VQQKIIVVIVIIVSTSKLEGTKMSSRKSLLVLLIAAFLLSSGSFLFAQDKEEKGHVYTISTWKIQPNKIEEVLKVWEEEFKPINDQDEHLLSIKFFRHYYGPDWSVMIVAEYENLAAIEKSDENFNKLFEEKYPDKEKREEIFSKVGKTPGTS
jgi:hypothetical protein